MKDRTLRIVKVAQNIISITGLVLMGIGWFVLQGTPLFHLGLLLLSSSLCPLNLLRGQLAKQEKRRKNKILIAIFAIITIALLLFAIFHFVSWVMNGGLPF